MSPAVELTDDVLHVRLSRWHEVAGLLRDLRVPLTAVTSVEVVGDGLAAPRGLRAPGLALPGSTRVGTWRHRQDGRTARSSIAVRRGVPALRIGLADQRYVEAVVSLPDAEQVAARLPGRR